MAQVGDCVCSDGAEHIHAPACVKEAWRPVLTLLVPVCVLLCRNGFLSMLFSVLSLLPMSCFLYMELCTIAAYGWGWMRAWNLMDMVRGFPHVEAAA